MLTWIYLPTFACALLVFSFTRPADEKKAPEDSAEVRVRLRLNAIETSTLLERFEALVKRELSLQDSVRACIKSGEERLPQYQQALQEAQDDLGTTKKRLVALESEKAKLSALQGKQNTSEALLEPVERANRTLERILQRLGSIEKRLEKIERRNQSR